MNGKFNYLGNKSLQIYMKYEHVIKDWRSILFNLWEDSSSGESASCINYFNTYINIFVPKRFIYIAESRITRFVLHSVTEDNVQSGID